MSVDLPAALKAHVVKLAQDIGERSLWQPEQYEQAAAYIESMLRDAGWGVTRQTYEAPEGRSHNIIAERLGTQQPEQIVVIAAHYDSLRGTVGANDNASGVAALLELARAFNQPLPRTVRLVALANEEPPFFMTDLMGSYVYAKACRERGDNVVAMISFDGLGYYSDEPGSQRLPTEIETEHPAAGNFISVVGKPGMEALADQVQQAFRSGSRLPIEAGIAPETVPGVAFSDHWSFWQFKYPAVMLTDTLPFRYPHYHSKADTPEKLDYKKMAGVVRGMEAVINALAEAPQ